MSHVGGPAHNPLPPACSPELKTTSFAKRNSQNGQQCPANKLVIRPARPVRDGAAFTVTVFYTGRPGVHTDGDGTTEGWFASDKPTGDGGFVTTEPVGTEDWMPLNDHPSAKPTYDFRDTVNAGRTVLANGILMSVRRHPPGAGFPGGSVTWHWRSAAPVASYLVENSVGNYRLTRRTVGGIPFYQAQASSLTKARQRTNRRIMDMQPDITRFEAGFNGPYPFSSGGVVVGRPSASFEEEMQTMITFAGGEIDTDTLWHENMHQWWGDHVTEANYNLTFFKEGMATLGEFLFAARTAANAAGGLGTPAGRRAFQRSLVRQFNGVYKSKGEFWTGAPSNPTPYTLFDGNSTYERPGISYIALRQNPRPPELQPGAAADPAAVRRRAHHRGAAGGELAALAAEPERGLRGQAGHVLRPVVRHQLPARRRLAPAADHRSRPGRAELLRQGRVHQVSRAGGRAATISRGAGHHRPRELLAARIVRT